VCVYFILNPARKADGVIVIAYVCVFKITQKVLDEFQSNLVDIFPTIKIPKLLHFGPRSSKVKVTVAVTNFSPIS
jgi:hypothetical protein